MRAKVFGTSDCPRLSVYRSNKHVFLQLIDDANRRTLLSVSDKSIKFSKKTAKADRSFAAGKALAELAISKNIKRAVFDRGGYRYQGRVAKVADGARAVGLQF